MGRPTITTLLAVALLVTSVVPAAGALTGGTATYAQQTTTDAEARADGRVNVTVGQQLSTVVTTTDDGVRSEVEESAFELRFESAGEDERAEAVADRAEELVRRAIAIREDYENATRAHEAGEISDSEYAERIATLNARAEDLAESVERLRGRAAGVSALELRAEGYTAADLRAIDERLENVRGAGAAALLQRFTGRSEGEVRIETRDGRSIEVEGEDGELSREIERPRDGDTNITVAQADALETARADLGSPPEGSWSLERSSVHDDSGYYRFEFALTGANATGEAEVRVDGSSGAVFRLETEIEPPEDEADEREVDGDERADDDREELALLVAEGTPGPNETVTLLALSAGEPVEGATVTLNDERVGTTGENGTIVVTLPDGEADLAAVSGEAEGELEFEFDETEREDRELRRHFDATARVDGGTVALRLTYDGAPVEGATVWVEGTEVGTTDADGAVTFDAGGREDVDVEVRKGAFVAELAFEERAGSLTLVESEFETDEDEVDDRDDERESADAEDDRETEIEDAASETEDSDDGRETDAEETESGERDVDLSIEVVSGDPAPDATVTVAVTAGGTPVEGATVFVNDERVGTTDADGRLDVTIPDAERAEVVAETADDDAEVEFEFDRESGEEETDADDDSR